MENTRTAGSSPSTDSCPDDAERAPCDTTDGDGGWVVGRTYHPDGAPLNPPERVECPDCDGSGVSR